jgi:hypothetical protein
MPLQLRRGLDTGRLSITPVTGELIYVTDTKQVFVGDGTTVGGIPVGGGGAGYAGSRGLLGYTGSAGSASTATGAMGYTGSVGTGTGTVGYAGSRGYTGSASTATGAMGYTGSAGANGLGYTGSAGSASTATGVMGYTGSAGLGYTGSAGTTFLTDRFQRPIFSTGISSPLIYDSSTMSFKASTSTFALIAQNYWEFSSGLQYSGPNVVTYDLTSSTVFVTHVTTSMAVTNWIANFENVPRRGQYASQAVSIGGTKSAANGQVMTRVKLIVKQYDSVARIPNQVWLNGTNTSVSVYWKGGITPNSNNTATVYGVVNGQSAQKYNQCIDVITFDIVPEDNSDTGHGDVFASIESYSQIPGYTGPGWPFFGQP